MSSPSFEGDEWQNKKQVPEVPTTFPVAKRTISRIFQENLEAVIWVSALLWLAFSDPAGGGGHITFCPLKNLGLDFCPGCGLGRAVSYAFHGEWAESVHEHLLGIPAILVLTGRVAALARETFRRYMK